MKQELSEISGSWVSGDKKGKLLYRQKRHMENQQSKQK